MKTFIIAEAGSTWWPAPALPRMFELIDVAVMAGADAVKFQWCSNAAQLAERRHAPELKTFYHRFLEWPAEWHERLQEYSAIRKIEYMCSVYLPEDLPVIAPYVRRFKIASFEATDHDFLSFHISFKKPLVVSTGMFSDEEALELSEQLEEKDALLLCTSSYPCPITDLNLRVLEEWNWMANDGGLNPQIGLSDHSAHLLTGAFAVCAGAEIIEVHIRLDDTPADNPDYPHSLTPTQLADYISNVRLAETMLGDGVKRIQESERVNLKYRR